MDESRGSTAVEPACEVTAQQVGDKSMVIDDEYPRILRYAKSLVRDPTEAEDVTQETFLRAYRGQTALRDPQAQIAWLFRIATNVWVDRLRQRTRRPVESKTAVEDVELADSGPPLQQVIEQDAMSACVQDFLVALPDNYRAVLLLHDLHEMTGVQIAEVLGESLATVKIRLHRARLKLRAALGAGCEFSRDERNVLVCEPRA